MRIKGKKLLQTMLITTVVLASSVTAFAGVGVNINDNPVHFTEVSGSPFVDSSNRTQVPLRATMETYGCTVAWDQSTQAAIVTKDGKSVTIPIGQNYILVDGINIPIDTAAQIVNNRTYLPIRAVLEAFGADVSWNAATETVVISSTVTTLPIDDTTSIHFIDVGQGDAILIDSGEIEVLIDAGPATAGNTVANYIKPYVNGNIELLVATHEHADHIGGIPAVLNAYTVDKIIDNGRTATSKTYAKYAAAVTEEGTEYVTSATTQNLTLLMGENTTYRTMQMTGNYDDGNNNSIVSMLTCGDVNLLFMGDAEQVVELENINKFSDVDILKAGHHGSKTSSSDLLLSVVKPETIIVSAATGNTFKHPHLAAMQRFSKTNAKVYGTFKSGNIVIATDGKDYSINTSTVITEADAGDANTQVTPPVITPQPSTDNVTQPAVTNHTPSAADANYVGNSSTKKYHLPSCRYVSSISGANLIYFISAPMDYTPCKVCNP